MCKISHLGIFSVIHNGNVIASIRKTNGHMKNKIIIIEYTTFRLFDVPHPLVF